MLILKNARIVSELTPGFEGPVDVVVDGDRIAEVVDGGKATYAGAEVVDTDGATLLPGFIDAHVHLDLSGMNTFEENVEPDSYRVIRALQLAQDNLRKGFTTLRDVGDRNDIVIHLTKAIRDGLCIAPDMLATGKILTPTEAGNDFFGDMYIECDSPDEYRKAVRRQYQKGADWIKVMATGAVMNPGGEPGAAIITEEELRTLVETATKCGLPVVAHAHGAEGIKLSIRTGVRTIEHSSLMDQECIDLYLASKTSFMMANIAPMTHFVENPGQHPPHYVEKSRKFHQHMCEWYTHAFDSGVKMGFATDAGVYAGGHGDGVFEMRARVKHTSMTAKDVMIQATKNSAEMLMIEDEVGTIEAGKKANLVLINGKPDEDIDAVSDVRLVIKDGKPVTI